MDVTTKTFLAAMKAALQGTKAEPERELKPEQWRQLLDMAQIHHVLPLVYEAVYPFVKKADPALAAGVKRKVMAQVMTQTRKTSDFLELNRRLQAAGIRPLVVKGIVCRNLYPNPDCRASGDEDLLIPADRQDACHQVLLDFGMQTASGELRRKEDYEVPYRMEGSPLYIELHKSLFPPASDAYGDLNRFFETAHEHAVLEEIQGDRVWTLDPTDHLFYLICHAFKHFLHSGFGIRQVCDIILFADRYGSRIDWMKILEDCRIIRADRFAAAIFRIGSEYLGFEPDAAQWPAAWRKIRVDETALLEDLLAGGLYGDADLSRKHSSNITLGAVSAQKRERKPGNSMLVSVFPAASKLEGRYPWLKKQPYLVPIAWCDRLIKYTRETKQEKNSSAADALKIGRERLALLKEYGIIRER